MTNTRPNSGDDLGKSGKLPGFQSDPTSVKTGSLGTTKFMNDAQQNENQMGCT